MDLVGNDVGILHEEKNHLVEFIIVRVYDYTPFSFLFSNYIVQTQKHIQHARTHSTQMTTLYILHTFRKHTNIQRAPIKENKHKSYTLMTVR